MILAAFHQISPDGESVADTVLGHPLSRTRKIVFFFFFPSQCVVPFQHSHVLMREISFIAKMGLGKAKSDEMIHFLNANR